VQQGKSNRHSTPQGQLPVLQDVINRSHGHLSTGVLAEGNECDAEKSCGLVEGFCLLQRLCAGLKHLLHVKHIA